MCNILCLCRRKNKNVWKRAVRGDYDEKKVEDDDDDDETTTTATETTHTHATGLKWERESERMQFLLQLLIEVRS